MSTAVQQRDPARVWFVRDQLNPRGTLDVQVETADLGNDNQASVHVYDDQGHVRDVPLAWQRHLDNGDDVFAGEVDLPALERAGFRLESLQEQPFVTYAGGTHVLWGDSDTYDAKHYREQVDGTLWRGSSIDDLEDLRALMSSAKPRLLVSLRFPTEDKYNADEALASEVNKALPPSDQVRVRRIAVQDFHAPALAQVIEFLKLAADPANQPVYVHCRAGIGRTGEMVACYRMAVDGWPLDKALDEARSHGLAEPEQVRFIQDFAGKLAAGQIPGFPIHP